MQNFSYQSKLADIPEKQCSVIDAKGKHCTETPIHFFKHKNETIGLCNLCYELHRKGYFGD